MSSFHGTVASLHQQVPQKDAGKQRNITTEFSNNKKLKNLPDIYSDVPAAYLPSKKNWQKQQKYQLKHRMQMEWRMIKNV